MIFLTYLVNRTQSGFFTVHCRTLHPIYRQVALDYKDNDDIIFARMDLSEHKPLDLKVLKLSIPIYL